MNNRDTIHYWNLDQDDSRSSVVTYRCGIVAMPSKQGTGLCDGDLYGDKDGSLYTLNADKVNCPGCHATMHDSDWFAGLCPCNDYPYKRSVAAQKEYAAGTASAVD